MVRNTIISSAVKFLLAFRKPNLFKLVHLYARLLSEIIKVPIGIRKLK